ncbi:reverse transcriptase domain-containing protein [Tanacetum coccineum]
MPTTRQSMSSEAIEELIAQRVADALATYEINQNTINGNGNGSGSQSDGGSGLARWFETMEYVFHISNCAVECQVKYVTCTLLNGALTWWNSHVTTVGHDAAYDMSWKDLMKMMIEAYCLRNKIQKLESVLWNLTVKGINVVGYTQRFQELALLCPRMVLEEEDKVERYIWGLPNSIQGNVTSARTIRLQDIVKLANTLMDQKIHVFAARQVDNKIMMENNPRDNHVQQPPYKRQNVGRAYTAGPGEKKEYARTLPLCNKCKYHHTGPSTTKCGNCKRIGHQTKDCRSLAAATNQIAPVANQRTTATCYGCRKQGHYKSNCLKLKNQNRRNQTENGKAWGRVYALGGREADQDLNNIADNADA